MSRTDQFIGWRSPKKNRSKINVKIKIVGRRPTSKSILINQINIVVHLKRITTCKSFKSH